MVERKEGGKVRFSGSFLTDPKSCIDEVSLTLVGQMTTPNFVFKCAEVSKI